MQVNNCMNIIKYVESIVLNHRFLSLVVLLAANNKSDH